MKRANPLWIISICAIGCLLGAPHWFQTRLVYAQQNSQPNDDGNVYVYAEVDVDSNYYLYTKSFAELDIDADPDIYEVYDEIQVEEDYGDFYDDDAAPDSYYSEYPPLKSNGPVATGHEYGVTSVGWACYDDGEGYGDCTWYQEVSATARVYVPAPPPPPPPAVFPPDACAVTSSPKVGFTAIFPTATPGGSGTLAISFSGSAFANLNPTVAYGPYSTSSSIAANVAALISKKYLKYGLTAKAFGPNIVYGGIATLGTVRNSVMGPSFTTDTSSNAASTAAAACYVLPHPPCLGLFPDYDYTRTNPYSDGSTTPRQHIINKHILGTPTATPPNTVYVNPGGYPPDEMFTLVQSYNFATVIYNPVPVNGFFRHTYKKTVTGTVEKGWIGIDATGNDLYTNTLSLTPDRCRVNTSYPTAP